MNIRRGLDRPGKEMNVTLSKLIDIDDWGRLAEGVRIKKPRKYNISDG